MNTQKTNTQKKATRWVALPAAALAIGGLAACSSAAGDEGCNQVEPSPALVIVTGVHANAPEPAAHQALQCDIKRTLDADNPVSVVALDGDPEVISVAQVPPGAANPIARADDVTRAENTVVTAIGSAEAGSDGSDLIAAVSLAADHARARGTSDAHIVVMDSGLPDRGALDMTVPGMLGAVPADVADYLAAQGHLPDLSGVTVTLMGIGYTAAPQQPLTPGQREDVTALLTAVLEIAGADVHVAVVDRSGPGPQTPFTTETVAVPKPQPMKVTERAVYDDSSSLGFESNSTRLRDPQAATRTLTSLSDWLRADPQRRVTIEGTTANFGTEDGRQRLSRQRAQEIRSLLLATGVAPGQVTARGLGYIANPPDRDADGNPDPAKAALNRAVIITTIG